MPVNYDKKYTKKRINKRSAFDSENNLHVLNKKNLNMDKQNIELTKGLKYIQNKNDYIQADTQGIFSFQLNN